MSLATNLAQIPNITVNRIPRATATGFVDSVMFDNGTNVGFGTTSPNIGGYGANSRLLTIQGVSGSYGILELASNSANADGSAIGRLDFGSDGQAAGYKAISSIASFLSGSTSTKFGADLRLYTRSNNAGTGDPVERMRITSTGNVGIGTNSPIETAGYIFTTINGTSGSGYITRVNGTTALYSYSNATDSRLAEQRNLPLIFETNGTERMRISANGNVGIGASSPASRLTILQSSDAITNGFRMSRANGSDWQEVYMTSGFGLLNDTLTFYSSFAGRNVAGIDRSGQIASITAGADGGYQPSFISVYTSNNNESNAISTAVSSVASQSGFRFDASNGGGSTGRTAVFWITRSGFTSNVNGESVIIDNNPSNSGSRRVLTVQGGIFGSSGDSSSKLIIFQANNGTEIGSVQRNGGANVVYNTSSDRRLKEDYKDFNGLDLVKNVKIYDFKWKGAEHRNYGVIADELQEVVPSIVSGIKDETYEDGRDKYMGVDYGQLTPIILKAVQEEDAKVEELRSIVAQQQIEINSLKAQLGSN